MRTDKPEAELYLYQDGVCVDQETWRAHRELSDTLLQKIDALLVRNQGTLAQLQGIAVFQGPGSFTGLRIGITVANTLAYSLQIPIVGAMGEDWQENSLVQLDTQKNPQVITPVYGTEAHITQPRK